MSKSCPYRPGEVVDVTFSSGTRLVNRGWRPYAFVECAGAKLVVRNRTSGVELIVPRHHVRRR